MPTTVVPAVSPLASRRVPRPAAVLLTLIALLGGLAVGAPTTGAAEFGSSVPEPASDPFYLSPPGFETTAPGTVLRTRPVTIAALGIPTPIRAEQVLLRTTDTHGTPVTTAATVMVPQTRWPDGDRPLVGYQIAIDGLAAKCNPSYSLRRGTEAELALIVPLLQRGYAVVVTDYEGPRYAYGAGVMAGQATLDGIRAAERLPGTGLAAAATPVALWGYSGGGQATGWAAQLQPTYAPELNLRAVALGGAPSDMRAVGQRMDGTFMSGIFLMGVIGVSREYPELADLRYLLNAQGRQAEQVLGDTCIVPGAAYYPFRHLSDFTTMPDPLSNPLVQPIFEATRMGLTAPTAPVFLYHGELDEGMPFTMAQELDRDWCSRGATVAFHPVALGEHLSTAVSEAPAVLQFLTDRIEGRPAPDNCGGPN
ncbi:hypothetical protein G4X40_09900 [Rhodococcus sp. D2-41]|uniref:Lipase family protein n=1 Tax=Speluncibacter jeojiensis TaxID=2710754 RepID=A0A9X4LXJ9_9ACTN|nr:lipase family protein [Rhodococcus sp. D2-41]MDG3010458.1 hypothetical protein [Rhodococcus sp. D2-41]MDG3014205.1 lipase family protein [Corynebacteriales bacterium D3-21]